jgi:hypothetical protein
VKSGVIARGFLLVGLCTSPALAAPREIPALTPVTLRIDAELGSKLSRTGQTFPIVLEKPIMIDGAELVKAGAEGAGEVVWARKAGMSGSAGELVLAARWLDIGGRRLKLRSLHLAPVGADSIGRVSAFAIATAPSPLPVSMIGYFVRGRQAVVPRGALAEAKVAEAFPLDVGQAQPAPASASKN